MVSGEMVVLTVQVFNRMRSGECIEMLRMASLLMIASAAVYEDAKNYRISNRLIAFGGGIACLLAIIGLFAGDGENVPADICMGGIICFVSALALYMVRAIGAGDVKLLAVCGMFAGRHSAAALIVISLIGGLIGGIAEMITGNGRILGEKKLHGTHFSVGILIGSAYVSYVWMNVTL